jgi:hypothetical protein
MQVFVYITQGNIHKLNPLGAFHIYLLPETDGYMESQYVFITYVFLR